MSLKLEKFQSYIMSAWQTEHCRRYQLALHLTRNTNRCMITKYNHHLFQNKNYEKFTFTVQSGTDTVSEK